MEDLLKKLTSVLVGLSDIQPPISVAGMESEAEKVKAMKDDMLEVVWALSPPCRGRLGVVVNSCRTDAVEAFTEVGELLGGDLASMSDRKLSIVCMAMESAVGRWRDYLSSCDDLKKLVAQQAKKPQAEREVEHA